MRKRMCLILALALMLGLAMPARGEGFYDALLEQVEALSTLTGEASEICAAALEELDAFTASYRDALDNLGSYDLQGFRAQLKQRGEAMDGVAGRLSVLSEGLSLMSGADDNQRLALEVCREYAERMDDRDFIRLNLCRPLKIPVTVITLMVYHHRSNNPVCILHDIQLSTADGSQQKIRCRINVLFPAQIV